MSSTFLHKEVMSYIATFVIMSNTAELYMPKSAELRSWFRTRQSQCKVAISISSLYSNEWVLFPRSINPIHIKTDFILKLLTTRGTEGG